LASPYNRNTPIDREPVDGGNVVIDLDKGTWRMATSEERADQTVLHVTHFTTCPAADSRRRR
jgi:hypothetical protein